MKRVSMRAVLLSARNREMITLSGVRKVSIYLHENAPSPLPGDHVQKW